MSLALIFINEETAFIGSLSGLKKKYENTLKIYKYKGGFLLYLNDVHA